jgi:hypothetical protein
MKVFLSALEASPEFYYINSKIDNYKYNLMSFYYIKKEEIFKEIIRKSELVLIDSGAHSFQKGKKVDWVEYTKKYAEWIRQNDCDKILGYFEMDVDNIIGYENVLELRKILESVTDKIIPVWHKNRGIEEFKKMCKDYQGRIIAITGFKNEDIQDHQYMMFLKYAKKYNCKVHCLGMTRKKILDEVPFDFVDSSTWKQQAIYGRVGKNKVTKEYSKVNRKNVMLHCYLDGMEMQEKYYKKWQKIEWRR